MPPVTCCCLPPAPACKFPLGLISIPRPDFAPLLALMKLRERRGTAEITHQLSLQGSFQGKKHFLTH